MCRVHTIQRESQAAVQALAAATASLQSLAWPSPDKADKGAPAVYAQRCEDGTIMVTFQDCPLMKTEDAARLGRHLVQNYDPTYEPPPSNETRIWLRRATDDKTPASVGKLTNTHIVGGILPVSMSMAQIVPFMSTTALGRPVRPGDVVEVRTANITKFYVIDSANSWLAMK